MRSLKTTIKNNLALIRTRTVQTEKIEVPYVGPQFKSFY